MNTLCNSPLRENQQTVPLDAESPVESTQAVLIPMMREAEKIVAERRARTEREERERREAAEREARARAAAAEKVKFSRD